MHRALYPEAVKRNDDDDLDGPKIILQWSLNMLLANAFTRIFVVFFAFIGGARDTDLRDYTTEMALSSPTVLGAVKTGADGEFS